MATTPAALYEERGHLEIKFVTRNDDGTLTVEFRDFSHICGTRAECDEALKARGFADCFPDAEIAQHAIDFMLDT